MKINGGKLYFVWNIYSGWFGKGVIGNERIRRIFKERKA
ncbi:hypothetical protein M2349_000540 [Caldanaerobacter subterraneus subsp. tengcongensis MB4]|nr:hypothetical protein [Caldanaerobacter subterraneus subsp. tengcongensis MB4]